MTSTPIIEAVAFDMDGLTLNTEDLFEEVGNILMARRGKLYREEVRNQMMGLPAPYAYRVLIEAEQLSETWEQLQKETDEIFIDLLPGRVKPMPGILDLLDRLDARGMPRCICTSSHAEFADRALTLAGVRDRIDFVLTPRDVERGKPAPDIYLKAAQRMQVAIDRVLVLEDSSVGTQAGVASGAYVISVPSRHTRHGKFDGAQHIADGISDPAIAQLLPQVTDRSRADQP